MRTVARSRAARQLAAAAAGQLVLLGGLAATVGLGPVGWAAGLAFAAGLGLLLRAADRRAAVAPGPSAPQPSAPASAALGSAALGPAALGPADLVTLGRAVLVGGVTALVADAVTAIAATAVTGTTAALIGLAVVALLLDAVDGLVARRTGTVSEFGARFDMELDAFLIAVLSVRVAADLGGWVLAIGALRYVFVLFRRLFPALRGVVPPRRSARVIAAVQGIVLVIAAAHVLPVIAAAALTAAALAALCWSFGQDLRHLWTRNHDGPPPPVLAALVVPAALLAPHRLAEFTPAAFARIPGEALFGVLLLLLLPARLRRTVTVIGGVAGALLGVAVVLTVINAGFLVALARPFHPVIDWRLLDDAAGFVRTSAGPVAGVLAVALAGMALVAVIGGTTLAVTRLVRFLLAHRTGTTRSVLACVPVWFACAVFGAELVPGVPVAAAGTAGLAHDLNRQVRADLADRDTFAGTVGVDPFRGVTGADRLLGLRGKDVALVFIESYGRSAVQDPPFASRVAALLDDGTRRLAAAGYSSRSGWLTSPTAGGGSWLAHSTLLSGLWINNQERYRELVSGDRLTLNKAFGQAGWRTTAVLPGLTDGWPEQAFYRYDQVYGADQLGYRGPWFSFAPMPDQFTLQAFQNYERGRADRPPLFAEVVLISSHAPWTPLPRMVGWNELGDGSVFTTQAGENVSTDAIFSRDPGQVRADYRTSVEYSVQSLISYLETYADDRLAMVFLGDHEPSPVVVGPNASRDVPITVVAKDPAVLERIAGWGWSEGLRPAPDAPVWPMDTFRDRFLIAYGSPIGPGWPLVGSIPGPGTGAGR